MENPFASDRALSLAESDPQLGRSVSIDQAAQLLKVSRRTVYYRIRAGLLRTIRTIGGSQRVLIESIQSGPRSRRRPNDNSPHLTLGNSPSTTA